MIGKAFKLAVLIGGGLIVLLASTSISGQTARKPAAKALSETVENQRPLYTDYKGVRLGMTAAEVRTKLAMSGMRIDDQEFYIFDTRETAQFAYDTANKVKSISADYLGGVGAPDYSSVVGPDINVKPDGSMYKMVRYEQLGFWVSYSRTANNPLQMVTITISKFM